MEGTGSEVHYRRMGGRWQVTARQGKSCSALMLAGREALPAHAARPPASTR